MDITRKMSVLLIENYAIDFYKARLPLALFLIKKGWEVKVLVPAGEHVSLIEQAGIQPITYSLNRSDKGIFQLIKLVGIYRKILKEHPVDYIHSFRFQPNLLSVLANFFNKKKIVLHVTGLGIAFSNRSIKYRAFQLISHIAYQIKLLRADKVVFQNPDDVTDMWFHKFWRRKIEVIYGSGVDTSFYTKQFFDKDLVRSQRGASSPEMVFVCVSRLIWEKGIAEMVNVFERLKREGYHCKLWIAGWPDVDNPRHVDEAFINTFINSENIFFLGRQDKVRELLVAADVFLYPSYYREGIPRGILEALSMSLPIITTNMPGCNLTVEDGVNGYSISPRSEDEIYNAIIKIMQNNRIQSMGNASRLMAETLFSDNIVFNAIEKLYQ